eukprot:TRINITY_DN46563_c0_g1_i2.p1 TRINITY_DN46563_c0_g1~~TRINITY_DN46563_c0_g1_i2.p1  ORF type:complete len:196 (+),score=25.92 TRINITY_DN46563_c0_g1_i2:374-961(+)
MSFDEASICMKLHNQQQPQYWCGRTKPTETDSSGSFIRLICADVLQKDQWWKIPQEHNGVGMLLDCDNERFSVASAMALLHHIPGSDNRFAVMKGMSLVSDIIVVSTWRFLATKEQLYKRQPWSLVGLDGDQLEATDVDFLMKWESKGEQLLRYVAHVKEDELQQMAAALNFRILHQWASDGKKNLALYTVMQRQ